MPQPQKHVDKAARQKAYRERQRYEVHDLEVAISTLRLAVRHREAEIAHLRAAAALPPAATIQSMPSRARWAALHRRASDALETLADELTAYQEARTEEWQGGDRGEEFTALLAAVETAQEAVEEIGEYEAWL